MDSTKMAEEILQAVTVVVWCLTGILMIAGVREFARLHASVKASQITKDERVRDLLAGKVTGKRPAAIAHAHVELPISKVVQRHREAIIQRTALHLELGPPQYEKQPRRAVTKRNVNARNLPVMRRYRLAKRYDESHGILVEQ
jgi:hypothetical protein